MLDLINLSLLGYNISQDKRHVEIIFAHVYRVYFLKRAFFESSILMFEESNA